METQISIFLPPAPIAPHRVDDDGNVTIDIRDNGTGSDSATSEEKLCDLIVIKDAEGNTSHFRPKARGVKRWTSKTATGYNLLFYVKGQFVECEAKSETDYGRINGKIVSPQDAAVWLDARRRRRPSELSTDRKSQAKEGHSSSANQRGRPIETNIKADQKIWDAWHSGGYKSLEELANELNVKKGEIELALDRQRKRLQRKEGKRE